jgi:succinate dehydrogenase / fumarate reductase cytochrome b subunit
MALSHNYFISSIGKKQIMAVTGLGLIGFTVAHLLGNFILFLGADAFNLYAHTLTSNPLIYLAEAGLASMFLAHLVFAAITTLQNRAARPVNYLVHKSSGRGETFASRTMGWTGCIILVFLVLHLLNFKYGSNYPTTVDGVEMRDLYKTVIEYFASPLYTAWYCFAMLALGIHTSHGFQSTLQTWGLRHDKYTPIVEITGMLYAIFVTVGFSACAIYCHLQN